MKMKKAAALLLSAVMTLSLAACGGGSSSASTSSGSEGSGSGSGSGSSGGSLTINIWDSNQQPGLQQIVDEWSAESGVSAKIEVVDWDNYWTLLEAGASGGTMPDVFWMHSNTAQMYMENDILLDLDPYIEKDETMDLGKYYQGIVDLYTRTDGKHFAIPKDHDTIALLYNKAIFDQYGVDYPTDEWTWDDMYEAAKKITEASNGDVYGMAMNTSNNQDGWYNLIYDYGAELITEDHKGTTIGSPEGKAGMEMVRKITQGSWMINAFYKAENHADYYWALLPYADVNGNGTCDDGERQSCYNGLGWAASANTANPEACYSLISYLCSDAAQTKQAELGVTMAGIEGLSDPFANAFEGMDVSPFIEMETFKLYFRPYTRNTTVWEDALQQQGAFLDAWQNPNDPEIMSKACDNAQKIIEDAIAAE